MDTISISIYIRVNVGEMKEMKLYVSVRYPNFTNFECT